MSLVPAGTVICGCGFRTAAAASERSSMRLTRVWLTSEIGVELDVVVVVAVDEDAAWA